MDEVLNHITIPLKGLTHGEHVFDFVLNGEFFQAFENTQIKDADCSVSVKVYRQQTVMDVECDMRGFVIVECDRCLDDLTLKIDVKRGLTVGFGAVDLDDESDDVMVIDSNVGEVDLDQFVYDYICLSLPLVKVHPEGKCDPEMLRRLSAGSAEEQEEAPESPFSGLKDLLENKNN